MRASFFVVGVLAFAFLGSFAVGAAGDGCAVQSDPNAVVIADRYYAKANVQTPVQASRLTLWSETNDLSGLQTSPTPCGHGEPMIPADIPIITVSGVIPL